MAELADAQDLKSCDSNIVPVRPRFSAPTSVTRTSYRRGVEQLVARRAHNPEVVGSNPSPATKQLQGFQENLESLLLVYS